VSTHGASLIMIGETEEKLREKLSRLQEGYNRNKGVNLRLSEQLEKQIRDTEKQLHTLQNARGNVTAQMNRSSSSSKIKLKKLF